MSLSEYIAPFREGPFILGDGGGPKRGLMAEGSDIVADVEGREEYWLYGDWGCVPWLGEYGWLCVGDCA